MTSRIIWINSSMCSIKVACFCFNVIISTQLQALLFASMTSAKLNKKRSSWNAGKCFLTLWRPTGKIQKKTQYYFCTYSQNFYQPHFTANVMYYYTRSFSKTFEPPKTFLVENSAQFFPEARKCYYLYKEMFSCLSRYQRLVVIFLLFGTSQLYRYFNIFRNVLQLMQVLTLL